MSRPPVDTSPLDFSDPGTGIIAGCTILAALTTVVVGLRFYARRLGRTALGWDDWLCFAALLFHHALFVGCVVGIWYGGIGRDIRLSAQEDPGSVPIAFKSVFVGEISYTFSSPLIKLSVLALYVRIFPTKFVKIASLVLALMCFAWFLAIMILNFVQCRPLKAFWLLELQALPTTKCLDPILCFLSNSIANTVIDFSTLTLPIREVLKLHTTNRLKLQISFIFLLGGIALAASLVRTISTGEIYRQGITNFTKQFTVSAVATVVEIYVAIIGACLPVMMPLYRKLRYGDPTKSHGSHGSSKFTNPLKKDSQASSGKGSHNRQVAGSFERLSEDALNPVNHTRDDAYLMNDMRKPGKGYVRGTEQSYA
jgi:hypothetical protein